MLHVNIVGNDNGAGLSRDARLVRAGLAAPDIRTTWSKSYAPKGLRGLLTSSGAMRWLMPSFDVNVFLERFDPAWFAHAACNALIPNPEWFMPELHEGLAGIDVVLCKSRQAVEIFEGMGKRCIWIGFTSEDRHGSALAASHPMRALHLAGRSIYKGTDAVLAAWRRHPQWPTLTVVQRPHVGELRLDTTPAPNICFITERLGDEETLALQREHPLHVLPSEVEGYGQALAEAMSVGAIVVTTDAPPMNEIVEPGRGVLVPAGAPEAMQLGRRVRVDPAGLDAAIAGILAWSPQHCVTMGMSARRWFVENDLRFRKELPVAIRHLAKERG